MKAGDTFRAAPPAGARGRYDEHLWIIISDPSVDADHVVIVNFTTHDVDEEQICIVMPGEHPFVKRKTAIRYWDAKDVSLATLQTLLNQRQLSPDAPLSEEILARIREGASRSDFIPPGCLRILEEQRLI